MESRYCSDGSETGMGRGQPPYMSLAVQWNMHLGGDGIEDSQGSQSLLKMLNIRILEEYKKHSIIPHGWQVQTFPA